MNFSGRSIFTGLHDGDGGLRVVNIQRAASGDEFYQAGGAVVVADIERNGDALNSWAGAMDGKSQHPNQVPEAASFVLAGHAGRHGHINIINGAGEKNRETDSGFLRGFRDFNRNRPAAPSSGDGGGCGRMAG